MGGIRYLYCSLDNIFRMSKFYNNKSEKHFCRNNDNQNQYKLLNIKIKMFFNAQHKYIRCQIRNNVSS